MINTIRADFFRLFRSKGFYITQLLLIALVALSILTKSLGSSGMSLEQLTAFQINLQDATWNSYQTVIAMSTMAAFLMYFCLPLFVMVLGYDLTKKTYKNQLAVGISRKEFFLSKYIIFLLVSALQFLFYYFFTFVTAGIRYGFGTAPDHFWLDFLRMILIQFIAFQAIFAIGLFFLLLTFSNVAAIIAVIVGGLVTGIFTAIFPKADWLKYLDFQSNLNLAWLQEMPDHYWFKAIVTACLFSVIVLLAAYQLFRKRDL
jgi:ABC-2 type transport system permease protein